eukprot:NP_510206.2 PHd Finger family [Caenorhabditis elegans]
MTKRNTNKKLAPKKIKEELTDMTPKMRGECSSSSQDHESDDDAEWDYKEQKACCICARRGEVLWCHSCPASFHIKCLGYDTDPQPNGTIFTCRRCQKITKTDRKKIPELTAILSANPKNRMLNEAWRNYHASVFLYHKKEKAGPPTGPLRTQHLYAALSRLNPMNTNGIELDEYTKTLKIPKVLLGTCPNVKLEPLEDATSSATSGRSAASPSAPSKKIKKTQNIEGTRRITRAEAKRLELEKKKGDGDFPGCSASGASSPVMSVPQAKLLKSEPTETDGAMYQDLPRYSPIVTSSSAQSIHQEESLKMEIEKHTVEQIPEHNLPLTSASSQVQYIPPHPIFRPVPIRPTATNAACVPSPMVDIITLDDEIEDPSEGTPQSNFLSNDPVARNLDSSDSRNTHSSSEASNKTPKRSFGMISPSGMESFRQSSFANVSHFPSSCFPASSILSFGPQHMCSQQFSQKPPTSAAPQMGNPIFSINSTGIVTKRRYFSNSGTRFSTTKAADMAGPSTSGRNMMNHAPLGILTSLVFPRIYASIEVIGRSPIALTRERTFIGTDQNSNIPLQNFGVCSNWASTHCMIAYQNPSFCLYANHVVAVNRIRYKEFTCQNSCKCVSQLLSYPKAEKTCIILEDGDLIQIGCIVFKFRQYL